MNANVKWMEKLLEKQGDKIKIISPFIVSQDSPSGSRYLVIESPTFLNPGSILYNDTESYTVDYVDIDTREVYLTSPTLSAKHEGDLLRTTEIGYCKFITSPKRVTQDILEFTRRARVKRNLTINQGALIWSIGRTYFLIGAERGQVSISLRLREINTRISIYGPADTNDNQTGFGPGSVRYSRLVASDVPCYSQALTGQLIPGGSVGMEPITVTLLLIPRDYEVKIGYRVTNEFSYKVIGVDPSSYKNMNLLTVTYDITHGLG